MVSVGGPEWQKATDVFRDADAKSRAYADEVIRNLELADLVSTVEGQELFKRAAARALVASENYRGAAELARNVLQEIASGLADI